MATFYNQATLSFNGSTTTSNITQGELRESLTITKTAVTDTYALGDDVTYIISITNNSATEYSNILLSDDLGGYEVGAGTVYPLEYVEGSMRRYVNGDLTAPPTVTAGPPVSISAVEVPANGNVILVYEARITQYAPPYVEGAITNTVTLTGDGVLTPITAQETISAASRAALTISKSISPTVVSENGTLTYTFVIQNSGNVAATAEDTIIVTDTFDPRLKNISVTYNGTAWTEGVNYTYSEATGLFTTATGQITVPAAAYSQDAQTGAWTLTPGTAVITVKGTV